MQLTRASIDAAVGRGKAGQRVELADDREPGIRAGERGAKWSVLVRTPAGKRIRVPLGAWPALGIAEAREQARTVRRSVEEGRNPNAERKQQTDCSTVADLLEIYANAKLGSLRTGDETRKSLAMAIAGFADRDPRSLTRADVAATIDRVAQRAPVHANRMLAYLRAFFGWAVGRGHIEENPAVHVAKPTKEVPRDRTPSLVELSEIWMAADKLGYPFGAAVKLLILTAARRDEVTAMRVSELEFDRGGEGVWTIPAARSKNGRAIRVPLSKRTVTVIQAALARRPKGSDLIFSTNGATVVTGWSKAKARLDKIVNEARPNGSPMPPWRLHDLRRSFATIACDVLHVDAAVADRCLNHVGASTTSTISRVYGRRELFEQRRDALTRWTDLLLPAILIGGA